MSEKRVLSPPEIEDEGWRGRIVGVTRIGGKAGFTATGFTVRLDDRAAPIIPETIPGRVSGSSTSSDGSGQDERPSPSAAMRLT